MHSIYTYIHIHIYKYIYICIHVCIHKCIYVYICMLMYICIYVYMHVHIYICICRYGYIYMYMHIICMDMCIIYMHVIYICIYTCARIHTSVYPQRIDWPIFSLRPGLGGVGVNAVRNGESTVTKGIVGRGIGKGSMDAAVFEVL